MEQEGCDKHDFVHPSIFYLLFQRQQRSGVSRLWSGGLNEHRLIPSPTQIPPDELLRGPIRLDPLLMRQEAVDLVGEDQLLERDVVRTERLDEHHGFVERTLRSSSPWINRTGERHVSIEDMGEDSSAMRAALTSLPGSYAGTKLRITLFQS